MRYGFHLASLPHHGWSSVALPLAEMGFQAVAVRVDASWADGAASATDRLRRGLEVFNQHRLDLVIDTDGKFLTDPWNIDAPSLSKAAESAARETLLARWIELAGQVGASQLTFTVGALERSEDLETVLKRLAVPLGRLMRLASGAQVQLGLRPALGSVVETSSQFDRLLQWLPRDQAAQRCLGWAADIALMARRGELPIGDRLARSSERLSAVFLSDMAAGIAGDMRLGTGDLALERILAALQDQGFQGPVIFRCEGYADAGLELAREAMRVTSRHAE